MTTPHPCYRVCLWDEGRSRWSPVVARTRSLIRTLRQLKRQGIKRHEVWVELRPGKHVAFPLPSVLGPGRGIRLYGG